MLLRLFLLFTIVPFLELMLLIWIATRTSFGLTLVLVLSTGLLGAALARRQGLKAWTAIRSDLQAGRVPAASVMDGLLILVASTLLVTPGLITDCTGFALLIPAVRQRVRQLVIARLSLRIQTRVRKYQASGEVIDAEFRRTDAPVIDAPRE